MSDGFTCPRCGASLPSEGWQGLCPHCLVRVSLRPVGTPSTASPMSPSDRDEVEGIPTVRLESDLLPQQLGASIGRYKLLQQIGEGGFGIVFMAEQTEPVQRKVALKVIKAGMDTREIIARFEAERQALALMDHPNIAQVLDGGTTTSGRPYFVMELVRGIPLTAYCDEAALSTRERLELFIKVCRAVQHAHQKGVIHRDLKPSNVLVTVHDGEPLPKVIDFGVAKALGQRLTEKTLFTSFEQMIGTPAYMSPEQAALGGLDIDTRSDIYSLGVLLYELLTGVTPLDEETLRRGALDEIRRMIRETDPPKPSTRLLTLGDRLTEVAKHRHVEPAVLSCLLRGDLDWITMKALEKDRQRRYETVNGFAVDIERHLRDEPVTARPPSALYRLRKTGRRHRVFFGASAVVAVALVLGAAISTWQAVRAGQAEREQANLRRRAQLGEKNALLQARRSEQVVQFLQDMLYSVKPTVAMGRDTSLLRDVLSNATERVSSGLKGQPEVEADLRNIIGEVYEAIGDYRESEAMHRASLAARREQSGSENLAVAASLNNLGVALMNQGKTVEAETLLRDALAIRKKLLGARHAEVATSLNNLGLALLGQGKVAEAKALLEEGLEMRKTLLGDEHPNTCESLDNLAWLRSLEADFHWGLSAVGSKEGQAWAMISNEAWTNEAKALDTRRKLLGDAHPDIAKSLNHLAYALVEGNPTEAERLFHEALSIQTKVLGPDHPDLGATFGGLVCVLRVEGKLAEAEVFRRKALALERRHWGETSELAHSLADLAFLLREEHKLSEAEALLRASLAMQKKVLGGDHPDVAMALGSLGGILDEQGKLAEAELVYRDTIAAYKKLPGDQDQWVGGYSSRLERLLLAAGKPEQAETLCCERLAVLRARLPPKHSELAVPLSELVDALLDQKKFSEAEPFARECLAVREEISPEWYWTFASGGALGACLLGQNKYAEAEPLLLLGYEGEIQHPNGLEPLSGAPLQRLKVIAQNLIRLYEETGHAAEAIDWKQKLAELEQRSTKTKE